MNDASYDDLRNPMCSSRRSSTREKCVFREMM